MNVTDIDDKIIKRGRTNYLVEKYILETSCPKQILKDVKEAMIVRIKNWLYHHLAKKMIKSKTKKTKTCQKRTERKQCGAYLHYYFYNLIMMTIP